MKHLRRDALVRTLALCAAALAVGACGGRGQDAAGKSGADKGDADLASTALPELAVVGGAQDVWPFEFGLDAKRAGVESILGAPDDVSERAAGTGSSTGRVITWTYPDVTFTFFIDAHGRDEYLLSAAFTSPEIPLGNGLSVGMPAEAARALLGEPDVRDESLSAYFYYTSTIELHVTDGTVTRIVLARALP